MIKFKHGTLTTAEGVTKDIIVKTLAPNKVKDALIGGGLVLMGSPILL